MENDLHGATSIGFNTFQLEADTATNGIFRLFYLPANPQAINLRYIVILNEQQLAAFDDAQNVYHDVTLQPGEQAALNLRLPPLPQGIHDVIVLGLVKTEVNSDGNVIALPYRVTLVVSDTPTVSVQKYQILEPDGQKFGDEAFFNLSLHLDRSRHIWAWPEVYKRVQGRLEFYIGVGYMESVKRLAEYNISPQPSPSAIMAFLDSEQIAILPESDVFYGIVTPTTLYSFIPVSVTTSHFQGRSDMLMLRIMYPRIPMCWLRGAQNGYRFDSSVYASRVGVEFE